MKLKKSLALMSSFPCQCVHRIEPGRPPRGEYAEDNTAADGNGECRPADAVGIHAFVDRREGRQQQLGSFAGIV